MMSKKRVAPPRPVLDRSLEELLIAVENCCNRAVSILNATGHAIAGEQVALGDEDVSTVFGAALERIAEQLDSLSARALRARTTGGGA